MRPEQAHEQACPNTAPLASVVVHRLDPEIRAGQGVDSHDGQACLLTEPTERRWVEQKEVARNMVAPPMAAVKKSRIEPAAVRGLENETAAGSQRSRGQTKAGSRIRDVLDDLLQNEQAM